MTMKRKGTLPVLARSGYSRASMHRVSSKHAMPARNVSRRGAGRSAVLGGNAMHIHHRQIDVNGAW